MTTTISKQLYVTIQYRGDTRNESGLLGFASPYARDSAFRKRKSTQDVWAYGSGITVDIDSQDQVTITGSGTGYRGAVWDASALFIANCYPRIIDNEPVEGFQIAKSVRRYGWSGSGNVVWRISDPRGFDLEIASENFASVINCADLEKGVIKGRCVWGREGSKNVLLPESSEPYQAALAQTRKVNSKVSLRDVKIGDWVEILSSTILEEDLVCQYLGKYHFLYTEQIVDENADQPYTGTYSLAHKQTERYLLRGKGSGKLFVLSTPKVTGIVEAAPQALDRQEIARSVSAGIIRGDYINGAENTVLISPTRIDISRVTVDLEPTDFEFTTDYEQWPRVGGYQRRVIGVKVKDQFLVMGNYTEYNKSHRNIIVPIRASLDCDEKTVSLHYRNRTDCSGWYNRRGREYVTYQFQDTDQPEFFNIRVTYDDIVGNVSSM